MPKLTDSEEKLLRKFSNKIYDFLYQDLNLSEKRADEICWAVVSLIMKEAENR